MITTILIISIFTCMLVINDQANEIKELKKQNEGLKEVLRAASEGQVAKDIYVLNIAEEKD